MVAWWQKKLPKLEALRQAQLSMIKKYRLRAPGGPSGRVDDRKGAPADGEADQLPPVYLAGFVLSGDWR